MTVIKTPYVGIIVLALAAGCSRAPPEPVPSPAVASKRPEGAQPVPSAAIAPASPAEPSSLPEPTATTDADAGTGANVMWTEPGGWVRISGGASVRHATYQVPRADGDPEDAELVISYVATNEGGSVKDGIKRWTAEFSGSPADAVKHQERTVSELKQTIVEDSGTYTAHKASGQAAAAKKDFALVGCIVEAPQGKYSFKLTGPKRTVAAAHANFFMLLDSIHLLRY